MKRYTYYLLALVCLIGILLQPGTPRAQAAMEPAVAPAPKGPGWHHVTLTESVSPAAARQAANARATTITPQAQVAGLTTTAAEVTPEIEALARALQHDPMLIFDYIHNHIDYVPIYGTLNGATGTLLAGRGTDADQAALFVALMEASGYTVNYVTGDVTYPTTTLANWVGTETAQAAGNVFLNGGIPIAGGEGGYQITRIWAEAEIGGTTYTFDPALKVYQETAGIADLESALGYNRTQFLDDAQIGATTTTSYTLNLNEANIRAGLITYTTNLIDYIDANLPSGGVADVIGGREIVQTEMAAYATTLPGALSTTVVSQPSDLAGYRHTLRIEHEGIDHTFNTFQLADRRVTIFYDTADNNKPVLRVDGTPVATGTATISGTVYAMTVTVDHPYNYFDQTASFNLKSGGAYALLHDFNTVSAGVIAARNKQLTQYRHDGLAESSEPVLGETLSIMGWTWLHEVHLFSDLVGHVGDIVPLTHHEVGIMGQEEGYFIDVPMGFVSNVSTDGVSDTWAAFRAQTMMGSAFEHGVLEQLQGGAAVSTIKMLTLNNTNGDQTFLADKDNWATVKPQLQNYSAGQLAQIEYNVVTNTHTVVLPKRGDITLNAWKGTGYIDDWQNAAGTSGSMGMIISGGYYGGYGGDKGDVDSEQVQEETEEGNQPPDKKEDVETPEDSDPVDMTTGAFHHAHADLVLGLEEPLGLRFIRSHNSGSNYSLGSLGYGWSHNYDVYLNIHSDGGPGLGARGPKDAAALIAYTYAALDLLAGERPIEEWMATSLATKWAMDQLLDNAVTVHTGSTVLQYIQLPDGSYNPPPGVGRALKRVGDHYVLQGAGNDCLIFDANDNVQTWQDANGNALTFAYDGGGMLQSVATGTGVTFTLSYSGDLITSVTDQAGRSVSYEYAGDELTTFRDAENNTWQYAYDAEHRLTSVTRPRGNTIVTNTYDDQGRVITQTNVLSNTTVFYFSGYRNVMKTPGDNLLTFYLDNWGRLTGQRDASGNRYFITHDGQGHTASVTNRRGDITTFGYDGASGRLAVITNTLGDRIAYTYTPQSQTFDTVIFTFYNLTNVAYPDGTSEAFTYDVKGNLTVQQDRQGHGHQFAYNARGQIITATNPVGGKLIYVYNDDGTLASSRDSDTPTPTTYKYDAHKRMTRLIHPDASFIQLVYDLNDQATSITNANTHTYTYSYDANGNLTQITDPAGKAISYTLDSADRISQVTDQLGESMTLSYNANNMLAALTDPNGNTVQYKYDEQNRLIEFVDGESKSWRWTYEQEHAVESATTPLNNTTTFSYNDNGWPASITDPAGEEGNITTYDALGRVATLTNRLDRQIAYTYGNNGLLQSVTLPVVGTATYTRTALGLVTQVNDLNGQDWSFDYTPVGRLQTYTDANGTQWEYSYDDRGRLSQINYSTTEVLTKTYDAVGHETRWQYSEGPDLRFTYDELGRMTHANGITLTYDVRGDVTNSANADADFGATYDAGRRLKTVSYAGQFNVTYTYDRRNLLTKVEDDLTHSWVSFAYNDDQEMVTIKRSNGITTTYERDTNGQFVRILTESNSETLGDQRFTLNDEGEVQQVSQALPYAAIDLLAAGTDTFSYDAASQLNSSGYQYDDRGRLTQSPDHTFAWNGANKLVSVDAATFTYNGLGNLTTSTANGQTTRYYHNYAQALTPIVAEKKDSIFKFYVWTPDGALLYGIDAANENAPFFYHFDRRGSTLFLTNDTSNVTDAYAYTPYGELLGHQGASEQAFTFVGRFGVRAVDAKLYQMRARFYDAASARFLSRDSVGVNSYDPTALNPYQYVYQNPLNLIDPSGEGAWNSDRTIFYTDSGNMIVQTDPPHGNYLGGWKYVHVEKEKNPPPPDPAPPKKEEPPEEKKPPLQPPPNNHIAEDKAAEGSNDIKLQNSADETSTTSPDAPPSTEDAQHKPNPVEQASQVFKTITEGPGASDIAGLVGIIPGLGLLEAGANAIDLEKELYGLAAGLQVQKHYADQAESGWKQGTGSAESMWELAHPGLSNTAKKLREHTEKVKDTWHYKWFGF